ncbi:GntR family transcriptional regulator [Aureimonas flava]|uniref:GntR family transcriptional regulator n=1 Tax=Aureimonas flava TaxID=2320271 RepID=A0A3A1WQE8_9HYPH|nr:GntR family transcriptional regulator [Aureimonas flava]RIY02574.1 GntR family transcriptional regulator [Aureimonas flava]
MTVPSPPLPDTPPLAALPADGRDADPGTAGPRTVALANRILSHIVEHGLPEGAPLREVSLATVLDVSRTPVRSALRFLQTQGHVEAVPNRGFFLRTDSETLRSRTLVVPPSSTSLLFSSIIRGYVSGTIPSRFSQSLLTKILKTPRSLLIKVLEQMEAEGIIVRAGQNYTFQPTLENHTALRNSYQLREALEPAALRLPMFQADPAGLAELRRRHERMIDRLSSEEAGKDEVFLLDAQFHEFLAGGSGNPFFLQAIQHQNRLRRIIDIVSYGEKLTWQRIGRWCQEHLSVIDALESGDNRLAADLLAIHLRYASQESERLMRAYFLGRE